MSSATFVDPEQPAAQRHNLNQVESRNMPETVYPLIWSFLLDSNSSTESDKCLVDFKSIMLFMHVSKTSKEAFDSCWGWWLCALALKREAETNRLLVRCFEERGSQLLHMVERFLAVGNTCDFEEVLLWSEAFERMETVEGRIILIQSTLLPEASRLAVSYSGEQVSVDPYDAVVMNFRDLATLGGLVSELRETLQSNTVFLLHGEQLAGYIGMLREDF